jgi:hypothetical protein
LVRRLRISVRSLLTKIRGVEVIGNGRAISPQIVPRKRLREESHPFDPTNNDG